MKNLFALIALAGMLALPAIAQLDTGIIEGTVRDASGAAVPNAAITITETQTNVTYSAMTSGQGNYVSPPLKVGTYSVSATAPGFKTYTRSGITLQVQDRLAVDAKLEVGAKTEQIVVTGEAALIQSETSSLGQVITAQQVVDMPLNGRSYVALASLTAGVINTSVGTNGNTAGAFSSNGVRGDLNNYVLDGIDNNNNGGGAAELGVNVDAIAEFKIQTSSYDAEFGRSGGAALNVVIKSGTNQIHGTAFEFFQNAVLNAQAFFATTKALSTKYNQGGGTIGFPIIKNKLFFFGDYQITDSRAPAVDLSTVPTVAERAGDFSTADNPGITGLKTIYDPATTVINAAGTASRTAFPNNTIPSSELSPLGFAVAQLYPLPNVAGATKSNYILEPTSASRIDQGDGRGDYRISDADSLFARYTQSGSTTYSAPKMPGLACGCGYSSQYTFNHSMGGSLGETHIFTPTTLNEFRLGFNWSYNKNGVPPGGFVAPPANLQVPGVVNDPSLEGLAYYSPTSYSALGGALFTPTFSASEEKQIRDTVNLVRGRHTIRVGGEMRWTIYDLFQLYSPRGNFSFTGQYTGPATGATGNGLADMLTGIPLTSFIDSNLYLGNREPVPAFFVSDDYKISRKLTLNLGLRYEFYTPIKDVHNHQANFDYATGQLLVAGLNGNSDALATAQHLNFGPRVGFAYNPFNNFVIRSGFGIFYSGQEVRTGDPLQIEYNLPYYYQPTFTGDGITPARTLAQGFPSLVATGCVPVTSACLAVNPGATSLDTNVKTPYYEEWNFAIQRQLPGHVSLEAAYVGSKGVHLQGLTDQNQVHVPGPGAVQARRPYNFFSGFASIQMRGNSNFNSFQLKADKHLANGLYFLSAFTYSHAEDDTVPICCASPWPDSSYNLHNLKSLADYQQKFRWVTSFDYQLPFGRGMAMMNQNKVLDLILGGWHGSGIFSMTTGFPFTPTMSTDSSNTGTQGIKTPNRIGNGTLPSGERSLYEYFNVAAFTDAPNYSFGNSGYNILIGPGLINLDLGIRKIFNITERQKLEFRAELFNALNHPNFGLPSGNIDNGPGSSGTITSLTGTNRKIQLALKYRF